MHKQLPFHLLHPSAKRQTTVFVNRKIPWVSPVWHRFWMPFMSVVHTLKERDAVLNHQKGAAQAQSLSRVHRASSVVQSCRCPTTWISNNNQTDEYVPSLWPSSLLQSRMTSSFQKDYVESHGQTGKCHGNVKPCSNHCSWEEENIGKRLSRYKQHRFTFWFYLVISCYTNSQDFSFPFQTPKEQPYTIFPVYLILVGY